MTNTRIGRGALLAAMVAAAPSVLAAQESFNVGGDDVAIYNLAGTVEVVGARGGDVTVEVARGGPDGDELDVAVGGIDGRNTLRVLSPADRIVYDGPGWGGNTTLRVRSDGTWGGDDGFFDRGDRVRISDGGSGMEAWADLRVAVPAGRRISIYLAVGRIEAENVDGRILLDTHSGRVSARSMAGHLTIDTGSGAVDVEGMDGDLLVDTGSGTVRVSEVAGDDVSIDTGSGGVDADGVTARRIEIDTGSGGIDLRNAAAADVRLDTGSGSVDAELTRDVDNLVIDTGSGSVTVALPEDAGARLEVETGSGGIDVDFPVMVSRRARDELRGEIGDGRGTIEIDTGSGSVRIRRL
jgi:lia operon protein LiaG